MSKTNTKTKPNAKKVMTGMFRLSFPNLFEPTAMDEKSKPKYGITMLFPKDTDLSELEAAHDAALEDGIEKLWKGKKPKNLRSPFRDGDEDDSYNDKEGFPGNIFIRATSLQRPGVVAKDRDPDTGKPRVIDDPAEIYAGCYCRATVQAYPYDVAGNKGVAFGLQNVQMLKDGEAFSGRMKADDEFDDEDYDDDEDFLEDDE